MSTQVTDRFVFNIGGGKIKPRREIMDGRTWVVVPFVSIKGDTVLNGSNGPGLYPDEENEKWYHSWNMKPITLNHPSLNGEPVTAANPDIITNRQVGMIMGSYNKNKKLGGEAWIDELKANSLDARLVYNLDKGNKVEISSGLKADHELTPGKTADGTAYDFIVRNHNPDHLAVLLDSVGALSVKAGGGLLVNSSNVLEGHWTVISKSISENLKHLSVNLVNNELSFGQITRQLCELLCAKYGKPGKYWGGWIVATYEDSVVFENEDGKCYITDYKEENNIVSLQGEAIEVVRTVSYKAVDSGKVYHRNESNSLQEIEMPKEKESAKGFDKKKYIANLLANGFDESEKEYLEKMPDDLLQKIKPKETVVNEEEDEEDEVKPYSNKKKKVVQEEVENKEFDYDKWLKQAPPKLQEAVNDSITRNEEERKQLTELIANTEGNEYTVDEMNKMKLPELRKLAKVIAGTVKTRGPEALLNSFGGAAAPFTVTNAEGKKEELPKLVPTSIWDKK